MEILILGGGPAGAAAAISLCEFGAQVTIVDRASDNRPGTGELLASYAKPFLIDLGVYEDCIHNHLPAPGVVSNWETQQARENDFIFSPHGEGLLLDRNLFDRQLLEQAMNKGATALLGWRPHSVTRNERGDRWSVRMDLHGERQSLNFDWLIDATGRTSWLARRLGTARVIVDKLIGIVGFLRKQPDGDCRLFLEAVEDGWWYFANLPCHRAVATYLTDSEQFSNRPRNPKMLWLERLAATERGQRIDINSLAELRVVKANSSRLTAVAGKRWLAVGDAAAAWDPLSSQGIAMALESGIRAATAILSGDRGIEDYVGWYESNWSAYIKELRHYYGTVMRWPKSGFWRRRTALMHRNQHLQRIH